MASIPKLFPLLPSIPAPECSAQKAGVSAHAGSKSELNWKDGFAWVSALKYLLPWKWRVKIKKDMSVSEKIVDSTRETFQPMSWTSGVKGTLDFPKIVQDYRAGVFHDPRQFVQLVAEFKGCLDHEPTPEAKRELFYSLQNEFAGQGIRSSDYAFLYTLVIAIDAAQNTYSDVARVFGVRHRMLQTYQSHFRNSDPSFFIKVFSYFIFYHEFRDVREFIPQFQIDEFREHTLDVIDDPRVIEFCEKISSSLDADDIVPFLGDLMCFWDGPDRQLDTLYLSVCQRMPFLIHKGEMYRELSQDYTYSDREMRLALVVLGSPREPDPEKIKRVIDELRNAPDLRKSLEKNLLLVAKVRSEMAYAKANGTDLVMKSPLEEKILAWIVKLSASEPPKRRGEMV